MLLSKVASMLRSRWRQAFVLATLVVVALRFHSFDLVLESSHKNAASSKEKSKHTIPTLLSVVDDRTGQYVYSLENPLYERLKSAKVVLEYEQENDVLEIPTIHLDRDTIHLRDELTLSWTLGKTTDGETIVSDKDIILLYCGEQVWQWQHNLNTKQFLEAATISQARATSRKHSREASSGRQSSLDENMWYFPTFPVVGHDACQFGLFQALPDDKTYTLLAFSEVLRIRDGGSSPSAIHLALGNSIDKMVVQFKTGNEGTPIVRYGVSSDSMLQNASGKSHTYTAKDMCQKPATQEEPGKFQPPGQLHVVTLTHLEPNTTYYYQVGLDEHGTTTWSPSFSSFVSAPEVKADSESFSYVVYGDQGCPSDGWGDGGAWTAAMTAREVDGLSNRLPIRAVHHMGDLSYARGAAHIWDEWLHMISSFTTRVPLMISVGNHEYDHTKGGENGKDPSGVKTPGGYKPVWGNFGRDSGGECGVPTANLFSMPNSTNSNGIFWYSFDFANVHTTVISSEHDLSPGSRQYQWLEEDSKSVDRTKTPWLILELHRSMYESEVDPLNSIVSLKMRHNVEGLLKTYQVDLVLGAHYHSYLRTCPGLYDSECDSIGGQTHITIGTSGAKLRHGHLYPASHWTKKFIKGSFGYGRITVANTSALHFEFVQAGGSSDQDAGKVLDETWIIKDRGYLERNHAVGAVSEVS